MFLVADQYPTPQENTILYKSPQIASYLYPAHQTLKNPKMWECKVENPSQNQYMAKSNQISIIKEISHDFPTIEQRINCSILCSLSLVVNPIFKSWTINYLNKTDQTKETAEKILDQLLDYEDNVLNPEYNYVYAAISTLGSVLPSGAHRAAISSGLLNDPLFLTANSILRVISDSKEFSLNIDLEKIIQICNMLDSQAIAELL
jgi:hypothetical protein